MKTVFLFLVPLAIIAVGCNEPDDPVNGKEVQDIIEDISPSSIVSTELEAVDLGLSVLWANMNVGAKSNVDLGNLYAWGELSPKNSYSLDNYSFWIEVSHSDTIGTKIKAHTEKVMKRYWNQTPWSCVWGGNQYFDEDGFLFTPDMKNTLSVEDDVATQELEEDVSGKLSSYRWRMPTKSEYEELLSKCTIERYAYVHDRTHVAVMRKCTGPNGNCIYFLIQDDDTAKKGWELWTSSLDESDPMEAWGINFSIPEMESKERHLSGAVRAVRRKKN